MTPLFNESKLFISHRTINKKDKKTTYETSQVTASNPDFHLPGTDHTIFTKKHRRK
jgi:hypothetical protein